MSTFLASLEWRQPLWLLLALQPVLLWLAIRWLRQRNHQHYADKHLLPWVIAQQPLSLLQRVFSRNTAYALAWLGFSLALAGPRTPQSNPANPDQAKLDIMLVIDLSRSMYATDIKPSRIRRAILESYELLSIAQSARVGVVVYAARPHLLAPLSHDVEALKFYLKDADTLQLPTLGSDHAAALIFAQQELNHGNADSERQRSIIWLTDGDLQKQEIEDIRAAIQRQAIPTYILGLATAQGAAIPLPDGKWLTVDNQAVITRSDSDTLTELAKLSHGRFTWVTDSETDWNRLYHQGILATTPIKAESEAEQWHELFAWFLLPAMIFLLIALFPSRRWLAVFIILLGFAAYSTAYAAEGYDHYIKQGTEHYSAEKYPAAKADFIQAVLTANSVKQRAIALHNLGNSVFKMGDYATASKLYNDALRYSSEQKQSLNNHKLANELIKILERRMRNKQLSGNLSTPDQNSLLFDLPEQLPSTLNTAAVNNTKSAIPTLPSSNLQALLDKGIAHIQLVQSEQEKSKQAKQQQQDVDSARVYLLNMQEQTEQSSNALWKRLFEGEEGFPGKLDAPKEIPGVQPW